MDELGKNIPDDFWRKAFDDAAETPPPRVWDSIERQLNESNGPKIIPLWGSGLASSRPLLWGSGIAAALALLFVGWWAVDTQSTPPSVAHRQPSIATGNVALAPVPSRNSSEFKPLDQVTESVASVKKPSNELASSAATQPNQLPTELAGTESVSRSTMQEIARADRPGNLVRSQRLKATLSQASPADAGITVPTLTNSRMATDASFTSAQPSALESATLNQVKAVAFEQLKGKPLRLRSVLPIQRIVWFQPADLPLEAEFTKQKHKTREKWASASVMTGAFNPMVSIASAPVGSIPSLVATASRTNQSAVNSRANFSMAYQATAGVQLTERWSVESGIGYLAAHSTVESPAQLVAMVNSSLVGNIADRTIVVNNSYVSALQNSLSNKSGNADSPAFNSTYGLPSVYSGQSQQTLTNDYQYMQVPIQVGYQLRPRKRLSLAVLGGLLTNIFVRNTVGTDVVVTGKDGVYRPISLAATMGARFRYRPSGRWSASLAGLYQPSLGLGTQSESQVQSQPTSAGMSFGVDYHF